MSLEQHAIENTVATVAGKATYVGTGTTVTGWLLSNEFAMGLGLLLAVGGFACNWYYKHKQDRREQAEHERRMGLYE